MLTITGPAGGIANNYIKVIHAGHDHVFLFDSHNELSAIAAVSLAEGIVGGNVSVWAESVYVHESVPIITEPFEEESN